MKASSRSAAELKKLADLPDAKIDISDIPERENWNGAVRGRFSRSTKRKEAAPTNHRPRRKVRQY